MIDVRLGPWERVLPSDMEVDAAIVDGPYSARVHQGNDQIPGTPTTALGYDYMAPEHIRAWTEHWSPRVRGWIVQLTSHDLYPVWRAELERAGRYVFAPIPVIDRGMSVRRQGDGPSSWTVWLCCARPRTREAARWGTLPGAYWREPGDPRSPRRGGKPLGVMREIVRDYSREGNLVLDTHAGLGTTLVAAALEGRRALGAERDHGCWDDLLARCASQC